jgi:SpoVK/Ycf46/Vps4 family AAA+-type ATPase
VKQWEEREESLAILQRDAALCNAVLAMAADETQGDQEGSSVKAAKAEASLWALLRETKEPVLLLGPATAFPRIPRDIPVWRVEIAEPDYEYRRRHWLDELGEHACEVDCGRLADTFRFGGERIRQTVNLAVSQAAVRNPTQPVPSTQDLLAAGRALTAAQVGRYAVQIEPRYVWNDLVLPEDKVKQLRNIASWLTYRRVVHGEWGFGRKLSRGKGLNVLFTGPSGTGKTMAAEVLAGELSLDLFQIDLSSVVSKYIGETEKNLSAIFREAEQTQALLFFDEADSLFGKRTEVKDAHDHYANIEVNYLLQRVEQYEGVVILATNLQRNIDGAFLRRMQDVVEFPFPDEAHRERIWRALLPSRAPRSEDIDYGFLAKQFKVPGGNIKNIVLQAAFMAAQEHDPKIRMAHLIQATKTEFQKQGKLSMKSDFGQYYEMIRKEVAS